MNDIDEVTSNEGPLQSEDGSPDTTSQSPNEGVASATKQTPEESEPDSTPSKPINQEAINRAINKQHFKAQEERRQRLAVEAELAETKRKLEQLAQPQRDLVIPPMPDQFDDDYHAKVAQRDKIIAEKVKQDMLAEQAKQEQARQEAQRQAEQAKVIQAQVATYAKRVEELGLDPAQQQMDEGIVVSYNLTQDVRSFLLEDTNGPLLVKYLANNPEELEKVAGMRPVHAAIYLSNTLSGEAKKLKPSTTRAPDPTQPLSGRGVTDSLDAYIKGATFE